MKVLVADDDEYTLDFLAHLLTKEGHNVVMALDGREALTLWREESPDLILAEADLPKIGGYELCMVVKDSTPTSFILLGERQGEEDVLKAFEAGADDYIGKPFSPRVLLARINAIVRRGLLRAPSRERLVVGDLTLLPEGLEVERPEGKVRLSPVEFEILYALSANEGKVLTTERIAELVWGSKGCSDLGLVKTNIHQIRQKLEPDASNPHYVITVPGVGYTLLTPRLRPQRPETAFEERYRRL